MSERDLENPVPEEESDRDLQAGTGETQEGQADVPFEVNEADAAEQQREIELDEDDYR